MSFYGVYDFAADGDRRVAPVAARAPVPAHGAGRRVARGAAAVFAAVPGAQGHATVLLVNGTGERLWAQAQAFAQRLTELGVPHEVIALEGRRTGWRTGKATRSG